MWLSEESGSEESSVGKPTTAQNAPAPPVVKKPIVKSKWEGEDEEESEPAVSRGRFLNGLLSICAKK